MSVAVGWKRFKFFDEFRLQAQLPDNVSYACCDAEGRIWLGSTDGFIARLDADLNLQTSFAAHQGCIKLLTVTKTNKLISIGEDAEGLKGLTLKAWDLSSPVTTAAPTNITATKLFPSGKLPEGTLQAIALSPHTWPTVVIAVGLSTGAIHLIKGDACKGKLSRAFNAQILPGGSEGITGLHFAGPHLVYATTATHVAAYSAQSGQRLMIDECGAGPGCSAVVEESREILLAGPEAVCFYSVEEGRKAAFGIKGEKHAVASCGRFLIATLPASLSSMTQPSSNNLNNNNKDTTSSGQSAVSQVFDLSNKIVGASVAVTPPVQWVVSCPGLGVIVAADATGAGVRLTERSLTEKLEALYRTGSYHLALSVAMAEKAEAKVLADVSRRFGDYLYGKRDYDGATEQYAATVGVLEPSYVIQRFLDAQRINNLTTYLEAVHATGKATADHTSLLLNCYTKLKDVEKLDKFVGITSSRPVTPETPSSETTTIITTTTTAAAIYTGTTTSGSLESQAPMAASVSKRKFDAENAVLVLRGAGYYDHALYLAQTSAQLDLYIDILVENCKQYEQALKHIKSLPRSTAAAALRRYGSPLLAALPIETTALLMELCLRDASNPQSGFVANLADFTHLYADRPQDLQYACVTILEMNPDSPSRQVLYHTLLDLYLGSTPSTTADRQQSTVGGSSSTSASTKQHSHEDMTNSGRRDALDLLKRGWLPGQDAAYDVDRALVVCRMHSFSQGLVFLYEKLRMYREALTILADVGDWPGVISRVQRHGDPSTGGDPQLWHYALERLASPAAGPAASAHLKELLEKIEEAQALPPLVVLPVLARNPKLKFQLVKGYVTRQLQGVNRSIRSHQEEGEKLKGEIEKTKEAIAKLKTEPVIFQSNRDSQTNAPLEPPTVHFLCGHSFNLVTLGDGEQQQRHCPICAPEHQRMKDLQRSHKASAADKDAFFRQLRTAPDGFNLIAEFFSKGLMNHTTISQQGGA